MHPLQQLLSDFDGVRVVCLGDIMLDQYIYGRVERVSAEAPIPVIHASSQRAMLGGVGNVARNTCALGAQAVLIAVTGDDESADRIRSLSAGEPTLTARLVREPTRTTTVKTRYIADGQQLLRADEESTEPIRPETAEQIIKVLAEEIRAADALVLSDYLKGVLTDDVLAAAIAEAQAAGVPIVADPKRNNFSVYSGVTVLKPNLGELAAAARTPCQTNSEIEDAARKIMEDSAIDAMMVSRSERGLSLIERDAKTVHFSARALEVFDVSGAGDTMVSTTAVALAAGADLSLAAELANVAAGIVVGKVGTAVVSCDELAERLLEIELTGPEEKVVSAEAALADVERWRQQGKRIGFTNGCFDLLHPGHVSLLTQARSACDRLVVGLNSDESIRRLKGEDRPVQTELARAIVLASLGFVDRVIIFSEDTPVHLLESLQPDVLIKGADYKIDEVVGADVVRAYGGEIKLATLVPGQSSTAVIAKMSGADSSNRSALPRRFQA
ncbi:MAG: D-glycero-beta-D-manno-heptose-7-phosphate kinase [Myxococcota bacterium]|nr:D-glycero-beta-D-manno-heptose-7-phosphate kinase [Myxococcota bacterium]